MITLHSRSNLPQFTYRRLWPLPLMLLIEVAILAAAYAEALPVTPFSAAVGLAILLTGLVPALLRPAPYTRLAAALAILATGIVAIPFDLVTIPLQYQGLTLYAIPLHMTLRLVNGALLITVGLHFVSRFPPRSPAAERVAPAAQALQQFYLISLLLICALLLSNAGWLRIVTSLLLVSWSCYLIGLGIHQLFIISRESHPAYQPSARQARLLLLGGLLPQTAWLLRLLLFGLGLGQVPYNLVLALQIVVPLTVTYAVLRHDLFDIDVAVRRALAYGVFSSILLTIYFGLTMFLTVATAVIVPRYRGLVTMSVLLVAAIAFRPLYHQIQQLIERLLYPERMSFPAAVAGVRNALGRVVGHDDIVLLLTQALPEQLGASWATLTLNPAPAVPGGESQPAWNAPLIAGDRVLGRYWLGPRRSGIPYTAVELEELDHFTAQAALALAYADTLDALNTLNCELEQEVAERTSQLLDQQRRLAVTEERQRLARDLHDSVTQTLFSINLGARALRKLVQRDPEAAVAGLSEQETAAQQALAEMRALLAQLRSPLLDGGDLALALRRQCTTLRQQAGVHVTFDAPQNLPLPEPIAHELLHVAREALHNVVKHGGVQLANCSLSCNDSQIDLTVADQGRGFDPAAVPAGTGIGLQSMQERITSLGGTLTINSAPGKGTCLQARVPVVKRET